MAGHHHAYHLVDPSPWPYTGSAGALCLTSGAVMWFHGYLWGEMLMTTGFLLVALTMYVWWRDIVREATLQGHHTKIVQDGLKYGMLLFITSEVCLFFSFFWAFFHSALAPSVEIGMVWPPTGIQALDPFEVPLLNTVILLTSGATVTWTHHAITAGKRDHAVFSLALTIFLGFIFTSLQVLEYLEAPFTIADSVYGSTFFVATGFHGAHVLVGASFLLVCWFRLVNHHFTRHHHLGFEAAAWYWHFVDYVWIFLFICIYWWGS
jgi:cytochrome c oxidase subunit 3